METQTILKRIRTIELQTRGMTQQVFAGQYQSAFKGRGMSFSEVRSYQIGDDVRAIDWNVTARFREPFVKVFEEERELTVMLVIDVSGSMYFGKSSESKWSLAIEIAATLGFSAAKKNDKVGALFVSDEVEHYIPPKKGFAHVHFLLRKLIQLVPKSSGTNLQNAVKYLQNVQKKRSVCFLISDFTSVLSLKEVIGTIATKHDLIALQCIDDGEFTLPNVGFVRWKNSETGLTSWVDTSSEQVKQEYARQATKCADDCQRFFESMHVDFARMYTNESVLYPLRKLFKQRK